MKCKYLYFYIAQQKVPSSLWCYLISEELARTYNFFHQNENCEEPSLASRLIRSNKGNQTLPVTISKGSVESLENTQKAGWGGGGEVLRKRKVKSFAKSLRIKPKIDPWRLMKRQFDCFNLGRLSASFHATTLANLRRVKSSLSISK